ncbi:MAG: CBS domain-containing protein [Candidatus Verstraetearchaeota archaeon]|jgi:CBS domain-containing protein|nr:CBS domain-containing protein [Candidatus Verstraetearchaeota archaeon]
MNFINESDENHHTLDKIIRHRLVWATPDNSIKSAAELMHKEGVSSVVIIDGFVPVGIITDSDLRRVIADALDVNLRLEEFFKLKPKRLPNLVTADVHENLYDVLSKMLENRIKHAIVMDSGRPIGMVTIGDIAYSLSPFYVRYIIKLRKAKNLEEVKQVMTEFKHDLAAHALKFSEKPELGRAGYIFEAISRVVDVAFKTLIDIRGSFPEEIVYGATGSWGRREQFLLTDRDTLAIYRGSSLQDKTAIKSLVDEIENWLDRVGFPPCLHGYTARNFIFEFDELLKLIDLWVSDPQKFAVQISLIADARVLVGNSDMLERIKQKLVSNMYKNRLILLQSLIYRPPESLFGMPKSFDLKSKAIAPLEYPIRALSITNKILSTSTPERIESLKRNRIISDELSRTLLQTYNIIMRFKIKAQLSSKSSLDLSSLATFEKDLLKNAIKNIKFFHDYIQRTFI